MRLLMTLINLEIEIIIMTRQLFLFRLQVRPKLFMKQKVVNCCYKQKVQLSQRDRATLLSTSAVYEKSHLKRLAIFH